ncbi:MAG: PilX N-terminal domain-containing pilus assembly protein [Candidatus Methylomirabilales bacterium]
MKWREQKGIALVITLLVMTLLLIIGSAFLSISSTETLIAINERKRVQAFQLAEAGAERAIAELVKDRTFTGTGVAVEQTLGPGSYTTTVTNLVPLPGVVEPRQIISTGFVGSPPLRATAQVQVQIQRGSPFQVGLFGLDLVELAGTQVDSYDSTQGPYDPLNPGTKGHIHSNNRFKFWSNNTVNGDVHLVGPAIEESGVNNTINGSTNPGVASNNVVTDVSYPACTNATGISPPAAFIFDPLDCDLTVLAGATVTFDQGTHSFHKITVESDASLAVTGPVQIYMTGQFKAYNGAVINTSQIPANLMIFSSYDGIDGLGTDAMYMDNGTGEFYAGIYALNGEVEFQNAALGWQIYGAIVAKHIDIENGAQFHYDVALAQSPSPAGKFRPTAGTWREVFQP